MQYSWPGNVRELEHTLERAVLYAACGEQIQPADLGFALQRPLAQNLEELSLESVESILIRKALQRFQGNVSQAAEALGREPRCSLSPDEKVWALAQIKLIIPSEKERRAPFERRIIRSSLWPAAPGLLLSGILIWLQPWSIESKLGLAFCRAADPFCDRGDAS